MSKGANVKGDLSKYHPGYRRLKGLLIWRWAGPARWDESSEDVALKQFLDESEWLKIDHVTSEKPSHLT